MTPSLILPPVGGVSRPAVVAGDPEAKSAIVADLPQRTRKIREAQTWLAGQLVGGPRPAGDVLEAGQAEGIAARTLQLAATRLHVKRQRIYGAGEIQRWVWELP